MAKHPEEHIPGPDYMRRLRRAGPRDRESYLQYRMRLASIEEGRKLVTSTYLESDTLTAMCDKLGITIYNLHSYLSRLGLTKDMLRRMQKAS